LNLRADYSIRAGGHTFIVLAFPGGRQFQFRRFLCRNHAFWIFEHRGRLDDSSIDGKGWRKM